MSRFFLSLFLFFSIRGLPAQPDFRREAQRLSEVIALKHVARPEANEKFSKNVVELFFEKIDPNKIFFTEEEISQFQNFQVHLNDEFNGTRWSFLPLFIETYKKNLARGMRFAEDARKVAVPVVLKQPLALSYSPGRRSKDEPSLRARWERMIAFLVYQKVMELAQLDSGRNSPPDDAFFQREEPGARERISKAEQRKMNNILAHTDGFENHVATVFLNAYAACADPHSGYLSNSEMEKFLSSFLAEGLSFGFDLEEDKDATVVLGRIAPGSQAWRSGQMNPGDHLLTMKAVKQMIECTGGDLLEAEDFLKNASGSEIEITIRKPNGNRRTIALKKEKIELEENVVRSYLLNGEKKIGYIALPGFYSAPEEKSEGLRCANDVAKEIIKLKKENIEGLIFDLRNNGGGSLQEALSMAGIFIDEGALGMIADKTGIPHIVKDNNRGTVYDGPLIVLVNGFSASASEFLAAALQDYNRAVIVGSATYGKGTAQVVLPLGDEHGKGAKNPSGYSKVTVDKIYRVTGKTVQSRGVWPDIILPDVLKAFRLSEFYQPHHLPPDSLTRKITIARLPPIAVAPLSARSSDRVAKEKAFAQTKEFIHWLDTRSDQVVEIKSWTDYVRYASDLNLKFKALDPPSPNAEIKVTNTHLDGNVLSADHYRQEMNRRYLAELQKDYYLSECYAIMKDYIQQVK
jgi:carboxyl-terminal processing protease